MHRFSVRHGSDQKARLDGAPIYLAVRMKAGHIAGRVQDENSNPPNHAMQLTAGRFDAPRIVTSTRALHLMLAFAQR
jgi:hypothetical protein